MSLFSFQNNWRDNLIEASWRGAKFHVLKSTTEVGRRGKTWYRHGKKKYSHSGSRARASRKTEDIEVIVQDYGLDSDVFQLEGYIIANYENDFDYFGRRNDLMNALKGSSAVNDWGGESSITPTGTLRHPYFGEIPCTLIERAKIEESFEEGGIARFTMTFARASEELFPELTKDYFKLIDLSALNAVFAMIDGFINDFNALGAFINSTINDIANVINSVTDIVNGIAGAVTNIVNGIVNGINNIVGAIGALLDAPCNLANAFVNAADSIQGLVGMVGDVEFGGVIGGCSGERRGTTVTLNGKAIPEDLGTSTIENIIGNSSFDLAETTTEQADNQTLVSDMMQAMLLKNACQIGIRIDFTNQEKAVEIMNLVADSMDDLLSRINDADRYNAIQDLRNLFVNSMLAKNSKLAKEYNYQPAPEEYSTLVLAYNKYLDVERCANIFSRNEPTIKHPGFISGRELRLLNE